jgi:nicotinate-nucleotide--dimethylbenzimidazole phosphoribosyltransferase
VTERVAAETDLTRSCPEPCARSSASVSARLDTLIKPPGSLGRLETLLITLGGLQATDRPVAAPAAYTVFAADHGVVANGVSPYPQAVTAIMLGQMAAGGAACAVIARELGARFEIVDVGTNTDDETDGVVADKCCNGTADFLRAPAMTPDQLLNALGAGQRAVERAAASGARLVVLGEMGIGNTTAAATVLAALAGADPADVVGPGTGHTPEGVRRKCDVVRTALAMHRLSAETDAATTLRCVGGLEMAALTAAMIAAAQRRVPVLLDGFIATVAARVAIAMNPTARPYLIPATLSPEPGHAVALAAFETSPLLALELRLGEGTGAGMALASVRLATALLSSMHTFADANIPGPDA